MKEIEDKNKMADLQRLEDQERQENFLSSLLQYINFPGCFVCLFWLDMGKLNVVS